MNTLASLTQTIIEHYGFSMQLQPLAGELDLNYKGTRSDGKEFVVKLMREGCPEEFIDLQCQTLAHLAKQSLNLELPQVIPTQTQQQFLTVPVNQQKRILWILTYCPGTLYATFSPHHQPLFHSAGEAMAQLTLGLKGFSHPAMRRGHRWELTRAHEVQPLATNIQGASQAVAQTVFEQFTREISPKLATLPHSVIHGDANDYNVLVQQDEHGNSRINSIFDFGDMSFQPTICELAVALAYFILGQENPIEVGIHFLKGYTQHHPLSKEEVDVLFPLIQARLAVSIAISSHRQIQEPDDPYITISQEPAKAALLCLASVNPKVATAQFRYAAGLSPVEHLADVMQFLQQNTAHFPIAVDNSEAILDLSVGSSMLGTDPTNTELVQITTLIQDYSTQQKVQFCFGRYSESRRLYQNAHFGYGGHPTEAKRTNHIGLDIFGEAGTPVYAPYAATVEIATINDAALDYGGLIILRHETEQGNPFFTLYGHLSHASITEISLGQPIRAGQQIATFGKSHENVQWTPHLHVQIILDLLDIDRDFPGVVYQHEADFWKTICPNPALLFNVEDLRPFDGSPAINQLLERRKKHLAGNLSLSYNQPLHFVSAYGQYMYDSHANTYLDVYNNVPHVGHQHPKVVKAIQQQAALLNTNTRYLHENVLLYAEKLTAKFPEGLDICFCVNSASEANELALRLARTYTKRKDMLVTKSAYHGHTSSLIDMSPYKHDGPGGQGAPDWVHEVAVADTYRGQWKKEDPEVGEKYALEVKKKLAEVSAQGHQVAGFIAETYPSVGGQIISPAGYLPAVYRHVREHGGLCIADEVQTGFGRLGDSFWAFETQEAIPDIVVLGKPIANGFPMGAVVTTREIAAAFDNGMEFFATFGGNPVTCAAATAVLEVVEEENLQTHAKNMGIFFLDALREMQEKYPIIGEVRGEGLFLGIELVRNQETLEPADRETRYLANRLKTHRILAGIDGIHHNVLKLRPSMVIQQADMDFLIKTLDQIFGETFLQIS